MGKRIGSAERWQQIEQSIFEKLMPDRYSVYFKINSGYTDYGVPDVTEVAQTYLGETLIPCRLQEYRLYRETETRIGQDVLVNAYELIYPIDAPLKANARVVIKEREFEVARIVGYAEWLGCYSAMLIELERQPSDD